MGYEQGGNKNVSKIIIEKK